LKYRDFLAIPAGLEPATRGVEIRYSIQLSYGTVLAGQNERTVRRSCCDRRLPFIAPSI
jgi:hypothetical protein